MSFWHRDQIGAARFQSSAAFRTGKTAASHCGVAVEVQGIAAEPGCAVKSQATGMARTTAQPEGHGQGAQHHQTFPGMHARPKNPPCPAKP